MKNNLYKFLLPFGLVSFCALQPVQAQSPGGVATDNTVWLKANVGTTLNPTNQVTTWAEQSGATITGDFSTHNPGASGQTQIPPTFQTTGFNFNPYLKFVASNPNCVSSNNLITGTSIVGSQQMTMFQVINLHPIVNGKPAEVWCKWQTSNTNANRLGDESNTGANLNKVRLDFRNSGNPLQSTATVNDRQIIYTGMATASNLSIRFMGASDNSMAVSANFAPTGTARLSLGNENEAGGDTYPTNIDIAEFILYKRALTNVERNQIESYLAVKYGMTLVQTGADANDYLNTTGGVIWNHTANAPYINNITGIGRDDASGLNQKQSLSINSRAMVTIYTNQPAGWGGVFPLTNADNTIGFADDQHYILFGDNLADTLVTQCSANGRFSKMARTWKVQVSGTAGGPVGVSEPIILSLKKANVPPQITTLIIANDPNFTTGLTFIPMQDNGTELYAEVPTITNGQYFTFGSTAMALNGVVTPVLCFANTGGVTLSPTGGVTPATYSWNSTPVQTSQDLTGVNNGNYTVTVTQGNGCTFSESFTVTGSATPIYVKVKDTAGTICTADNGMIEVGGVGGVPSYSYNIDGGPFSSVNRFTNLSGGSHTITIKDQNGCTNDTTVTLKKTVYSLNTEVDTASAWCDAGGLGGEMEIIVTGGNEPYGYFWNNNPPDGKGPKMMNLKKGTYTVIVTDVYGCTGTATGIINENSCCFINIPNAFSPNADGTNDKFVSVSNRPIPKYEMAIFDRWGKRLFYTTKYDEGWDGTFQNNGTPADIGTYYYKINYTCERGNKKMTYHGDLTLIR